ncbi:uroporphyrinogen-III synthase [Sulfolobus acidocaldarius]|uniref:uroporphyrinogen-III synthase n=1 Tax=Sulfolobus acidocaldarius TaxID=2285 RepID=UPI000783EDFC
MKILLLRPENSRIPVLNNVEIINIPIFEIRCVKYDNEILNQIDGIGFTSVNGVMCFKDFDRIRLSKIYAVGRSTAMAIMNKGFPDVKVPTEFTVNSMIQLMLNDGLKNPVVVRSKVGYERDRELIRNVVFLVDYDLEVIEHNLERAKSLIKECRVDIVVVTSSKIASLIKDSISNCIKIVSIGPITSSASEGVNNIYEAKQHDINGVLNIISDLLRDSNG